MREIGKRRRLSLRAGSYRRWRAFGRLRRWRRLQVCGYSLKERAGRRRWLGSGKLRRGGWHRELRLGRRLRRQVASERLLGLRRHERAGPLQLIIVLTSWTQKTGWNTLVDGGRWNYRARRERVCFGC